MAFRRRIPWDELARAPARLSPVDNQPHKNAFMQTLESRLQNILKTKSVLYFEHSWAVASSEAGGMKSRGLSALLIQHVRGPETLTRGTPRLHSPGNFPEARATPPFMPRAKELHLSPGLLQTPG